MQTDKRNLFLLIFFNILLLLAISIGIHKSVQIVSNIASLTITSFAELKNVIIGYFNAFMRQDIKIIAGILFGLGIVVYDVYVVISYFNSFKFTNKKTCKSCSQRLIREQRRPFDKFISYFIQLKRYRCVGCGQEYLRLDNTSADDKKAAIGKVEVKKIKA